MLDSLFTESFTVRRVASRDVKNAAVYEEVLGTGGEPLPIRCRIERRKRRIFSTQGVELTFDATLVFKRRSDVAIKETDLAVLATGEAFKVVSVDQDRQLFGAGEYVRLGLAETRLPAPGDKPDGG